ncbi:acyclic terpene utilization AtuA family protein [Alkalicella caledoniensis]|uniref:Acyclic terpene utilization AtuA family protein n=1 Tax=Alkalicella caledoniensis TaxID=2731377 RepID=A0A7G9W4R7_ALKCA|nr:acyclic terpene utilization AtuA family protein [Alkalicella caledoniensis]QNO13679.1 acyclic terpene utilization AtuA family protein [Alkalicella caledoniensis]
MREYKILAPTAILGYGFPEKSFVKGIEKNPDLIAVDAGSVDPGPYYLGSGKSFTDRNSVKRDLEYMLVAAKEHNIPVAIGSAGGSGAKTHLDWNIEIIEEIMEENNLDLKVVVIDSQLSKSYLMDKYKEGDITPLFPTPPLTEEDLSQSTNIVGQIGVEPFIEAFKMGADVVLAGRAYDPAVFAALPIMKGYDPGISLHLGKILECASIAASPGSGRDCMLGTLGEDYFILEPMGDTRKCTTDSVAAHSLYEKTNPYKLPGPGGLLDLTDTVYEQLDETRVKVKGSKFVPSEKYTIKLEGAKLVGKRTISIAGVRDPIMIEQISHILEEVKEQVQDNFSGKNYEYHLTFHIYGKNGVMGSLEPVKNPVHELGIVIDVVAQEKVIADTICSFVRSTLLHFGYPNRKATAGNLAFPYSPSDISVGDVYQFSVHHLLENIDPVEIFTIKWLNEYQKGAL